MELAMKILGYRRYVEISGDTVHELPPLLLKEESKASQLDAAVATAEQIVASDDLLSDAMFNRANPEIAVERNKMGLAARVGSTLMPGWIAELDGTPIMEETPVRERGTYYMLPLGTTREQGSHKGYAFSLMTEVYGMLSGSLPTMLDADGSAGDSFAAIDVSAFTDVSEFKGHMDRMLKALRETKPAPGHDRVLYPGLSEYEEERDRRANGIPLHREVIEWFGRITGEISIPPLRSQ